MPEPITFERFGGLNLTADPLEVGTAAATDILNVWVKDGRIETSPTVESTGETATRTVRRLWTHGNGGSILASESDGTNATLEAFPVGGGATTATTYASTNITPHGFASIGTASDARTYAVRTGDTTRVWNGTAWAAAAGVPQARCAAPADNGTRLAVGYSGGNLYRVAFSDPGAPETFGANNFVDITPGDGEPICDMKFWRDQLFVFKNTKFAVFYGVSTDADGNPIFNYRMVDHGIGIGQKGSGIAGGACVARDGVYFMSQDGIYRTRGDTPELVSPGLTPVFPWQTDVVTNVLQVDPTTADLTAIGRHLYVSVSGSIDASTFRRGTYVLLDGQHWTYLDAQYNGANIDGGNFTADVFGRPVFVRAGSTDLRRLRLDLPSTTLGWMYKTGRYGLSEPGRVAVTNETSLVGSGTVSVRVDSDLYTNQAGSATLGTYPAIAEGWPGSIDQEGTWLQTTFSGTGRASVSRFTHQVQAVKPAGVR